MKDLTSGNIYKTFFLFSIPLILSSLLSQAFDIVNTAMAGQWLGSVGLAATAAPAPLLDISNSIFYGYSMGASVIIASIFGAKEYSKCKNLILSNLVLIMGVSFILAVLEAVFFVPIFDFLNIEDIIYNETKIYYFFLLINMPFSISRIYLIYASNAIGVTSFPLFVSIIQSVINVLGNLLGLTVFDLGVAGIGIATVISNLVGFIMYIIRFRMYFKEMGVDKEKFKFSWKYIGMSLPSAAPNSAQQFAMYLVGFLIAPIRNGLGYIALAALSIVSKIQGLISMFYGFCARTAANYIPQCVGAKKYDKIKKSIGVAFVQSFTYFVPLFFVIWLFPEAICGLFVNSETEPEVIETVISYIKIFMPFMLIHTVSTVFHSVFRGIKSNQHLFISTMLCSLVGYVAALILCPVLGITGFYIQAIIGWTAECLYIAVVYFTGLWIPKDIRPFIHKTKTKKLIEK